MYTDRTSPDGTRSKPWTAGRFGFVRNEKSTSIGIVFTRFHEGVDIRPVRRDSSGNSLDEVRAIAAGTVMYATAASNLSNYGNYVVIRHNFSDGPFYSLSAHLKSISVKAGQAVKGGQKIGQMGYTGRGINRERSHVHLELNMLMSDRFKIWHDVHYRSANHHGIYNGFNLVGLDVSGLLLAHHEDPNIQISDFVPLAGAYYKVTARSGTDFQLIKRYPWLLKNADKAVGNPSWEITFSSSGLPLAIEPSTRQVTYPAVTWVKKSAIDHSYNTINRIQGTGSKATLTATGSRYIQMIVGTF
jgi:murein DD-endopeptidase MepM/ murein hydrolase activator NlpD